MSSSARSNVRFFSTCFFCRSNRKSLLASRVGPGAHRLVLTSHLAHWAHLRSSQSCGEPWDWLRQCSWQYQVLYQVVISESSARDCRVDCLRPALDFNPAQSSADCLCDVCYFLNRWDWTALDSRQALTESPTDCIIVQFLLCYPGCARPELCCSINSCERQ